MDSYISAAAALPESCVPQTSSDDPTPPAAAIDSVALPAHAEESHTTEFIGAGENTEDGAQENQRKRHAFRARGRSRFRGWHGMRRGVGGKFRDYPFGAIQTHGSDVQHGKSTVVESSGQQLVAPEVASKMSLSTTGEETMALEPPAVKTSLLPQVSLPPLTWSCDICRVDCNSLEILERHKTGKRHKRTVQLLEKMEGRLEMVEELVANNHMKPEQHSESVAVPIEDMNVNGPIETSTLTETMYIKCDTSASLKKKRKRNSEPEQPRFCVLCNAACNSQAMFESHLAGKKHTSRINRFQRPNTIYGPMSGYIPLNKSSTLASQDTQPLYYGLMNCEQPQAYAVLNPHLEQAYEYKEHLPLLDSEGQYGFIET